MDTHTIMPKKLAQALMEASMQHFAVGGPVTSVTSTNSAPGGGGTQVMSGGQFGGGPSAAPQATTANPSALTNNQITNPGGILGGNNSVANQIFNPIGAFGGQLVGMTQDQFQAQAPNIATQNFSQPIGQQEQNQADVYGQQQSLANTLLQQSQGNGPGQTLVAQQGGNLAAQQAALMASQRGASGNPALAARQAAEQAGGAQQNVLNTQAGLALQSQNALQQQQSNMANQSLQGQSILQGAQAAQNTAITQGSLGAQGINAQTAAGNQSAFNSLLGGLTGGIAGGASSMFSKGGQVKGYADGGEINDNIGIAQYGQGAVAPSTYQPAAKSGGSSGGGIGSMVGSLAALLACGGTVPAMLAGGNVPGKAKVPGDSKKNDTVPTMLSPGEDVIPRSIAQLPEGEMEQKAVEFLRHLKKKQGGGSYSKVAEAKKKRA